MARKKIVKAEEVDFTQVGANVIEEGVITFINNNYLPYAQYVIQDRALISVDGLKPVHRRVIQTMYRRGLTVTKPHLKAATVAGETMGTLHPHGNISIEDAMGRMAQEFVMRVPLIDYYGTAGEEAGDKMPSARYWEARLSRAAEELVKEIDMGAVELSRNFDGTLDEARILPSRWPAGIINGAEGIAVGYATTMPPHNPTEVMDALIAYTRNNDLTLDELLEIMPGPDFPTWGVVTGIEGVRDYYETGSGTFSLRGEYEIEALQRGRNLITFTTLPYQISPERVFSDLKKAQAKGVLKEISEYKNLGDGHVGTRVAFYVKAGSNVPLVIQQLFKETSLEVKYSSNMTVLDEYVPKQMGMLGLIKQFVDFRQEATINKLNNRREIINDRIERLEGIIKVVDVDLDKAISIIRNSDTVAEASALLMKQFKINEEQSEYILSMALRRLTKSDTVKMRNDIATLKAELEEIEITLSSDEELSKKIIADFEETKEIIADERRTDILDKSAEALAKEAKAIKAEIKEGGKNEPLYVTLFANGMIAGNPEPYKQTRAKLPIVSEILTETHNELVVVTKDGTGYRVPASYVNSTKPASLDILGLDSENIVGIGNYNSLKDDYGMFLVTSKGGVNIVNGGYPSSLFEFPLVKLEEDEEVVFAQQVTQDEYNEKQILTVSNEGLVLKFALNEVRTSNAGAGTVRGMITDGYVVGASLIDEEGEVVSCSHNSIKVTDLSEIPSRKRGAKGVILHNLGKDDELINAFGSASVVAMKNDKAITLDPANPRAAKGSSRSGTGVVLGHLN